MVIGALKRPIYLVESVAGTAVVVVGCGSNHAADRIIKPFSLQTPHPIWVSTKNSYL
ncbi:hypothetical protein Csa_003033 [Cucumis sativus]|uniref:Uncharacterized protein n=1 Tax=Cucumis sativus TaxID=3659 RepID=A0A0A0KMC8_CUCSA|nr:hypothetical protein Csa_003033 [Cucumis sativus]